MGFCSITLLLIAAEDALGAVQDQQVLTVTLNEWIESLQCRDVQRVPQGQGLKRKTGQYEEIQYI